ncbi:type II 3-dehydroquinate dehydratase [bacterium endosymbiont of Pedicinus badii]|uniref:type II 3-dehydroquinate dehydratase n=1 Tax=bacterium endosymbiont of Pedicinus badii TaxID=1719126 RepID=UPI0009BBD3BD|nr:type II 3-dehydroquinate dehydratase [bacterium endosymbiont of Pedicinus badii]OQM34032.1 3-dehydroquinate dehydratase [bacterium endosymbiont of Pedicinus badii]
MKKKILLINGPNINLVGIREKEKYGEKSIEEINKNLKKISKKSKIHFLHFQSNSECAIIEKIHRSINAIDFILINPASFTHTSIAIRDALLAVKIPFFEIHFSNIHKYEKFRRFSFFSDIAVGTISGFGEIGYYFAFEAAKYFLLKK